jgi:hypothetical protein
VAVDAAQNKVTGSSVRYKGNLDESFSVVGAIVPSFAGAYFGEGGELVVRLTELGDSARALAEVGSLLLDRVRVDPARISEARKREIAMPRKWRFERATHTFAELYQVRSQMFLSAFQDDDVVSLDIDERHGRVVIGVTSGAAEARVMGASQSTLAKELVVFENEKPVALTSFSTLMYRQRPITGGYQLGPSGCTTTIGARRGSEQLVLTNSHCSASAWALDGGQIRQNNSPNAPFFGAEVTDPPTYSCGTLFFPRNCRRADVTAYSAAGVDLFPGDTLGWAPGLIARTISGVHGLTQSSGSLVIDSLSPYWYVVAEINYPMWGETVHKVGINTGWTFGGVYDTCKDERLSTHGRPLIVCTDKADINMEDGDSGSPIFAMYGGYPSTVAFYGIGFGHKGGASGMFSNFNQIKQDLGSNLWTF